MKLHSFLKPAWEKTNGFKAIIWKAAFYYALISFGLWAISIPLHVIGNALNIKALPDIILSITQMILFPPLMIGMIMLGVRRALGERVEVEMMFAYYKGKALLKSINILLLNWMIIALALFALHYLMQNISQAHTFHNVLYGLMFLAVVLFLVVAGFGLYFSSILVMHQDNLPFTAIFRGYNAALDHLWLLIKFLLFNAMIFLAGLVTLGILFIWTGPWMKIILGLMYKNFFIDGTVQGSKLNNA